jgi:hypothetical protein
VRDGKREGWKEGEMKRDLYQCQKGPISVSKETYISVKRDLYQCQKRPISVRDGKREGRKEGEMGGQ